MLPNNNAPSGALPKRENKMYIAKHDIEIINLEDLAVIVSGLVKEGVTFEVYTKDISELEKHSDIKSAVKYVVTLTGGY